MFKIFPDHPSTFCTLHRYKNGVVSIAVVPGFLEEIQRKKSGNKGNRFAFPPQPFSPLLR